MQTSGLAAATIDRLYERTALADSLRAARARTLAYYGHLELDVEVPRVATVNLPRWELAHIAWFQELWCLRGGAAAQAGSPLAPSRLPGADALFDSSRVPHASRWSLPYPAPGVLREYMAATLEQALERLPRMDDEDLYFAHLALVHEDMHGEALLMTLQQLGLPEPARGVGAPAPIGAKAGDVELPGGVIEMGTRPSPGVRFVFDNERDAHEVRVEPFRMAKRLVTQGEFAAFVDDGGYARAELWSEAGGRWLAASARTTPRFWARREGQWRQQRFGRWAPLDADHAMVHVNLHEARAWCSWAGRRLPSEAEWEYAARHAGASFAGLHGCAWQWTDTPFGPYPNFSAGPYRDYSQPWFHSHYVLRGGSFVTQAAIATATYRNFYLPERDDPFAGFRSCAV